MTQLQFDPDEERQVHDLAARAEPLVGRREVLTKAAGALSLPIVLSLCVTRDAMGMAGSGSTGGGSGSMTMTMSMSMM